MRPAADRSRGEARPRNRRGPPAATYGAVDLGTHNCRMLMAEPVPDRGFRVVGSFSRVVRLGEGLSASGRLSEPAIRRAVNTLKVCAGRLRGARVRHVRGIATEACRRAANGPAFLVRVESETGLALEPITPDAEARLTLDGCTPLLDPAFPRVLLFDIGGGSTEVSWIAHDRPSNKAHILGTVSLPHGVVSFAERFGGDAVDPGAFAEMADLVHGLLEPFDSAHDIGRAVAAGDVQMIGTSGTVTTLVGVYLGLRRYARTRVDGLSVGFDDVARVSAQLAATDWQQRADNPCIGPQRADLVVAGCAILDAVCRRWPVDRLTVADRGIREGLLMGMIDGVDRQNPGGT